MTGLLIGAVFGAVFVIVNAQSPLPAVAVTVLRVAAVLAAAGVLAMWFTTARRERSARTDGSALAGPAPEGPRPGMFGRGYLVVVAAEVILLFGGLRVLAMWERPVETNVAWVALVVGVHFVALAPIWKDRSIAVPGVLLTLLGAAGLVLASTPAAGWVPLVSGVLSGVVLLAGGLTFGLRTVTAPAGVRPPKAGRAEATRAEAGHPGARHPGARHPKAGRAEVSGRSGVA
ncbi:hypothetical protein [Nonomuraea phyllanthi]|uniref:hypothetical protein n=1 Tax=Nonomuraea phyllanthi TaxID=2219224 RepID=UPI001D14F42C|nr:hypothetical protein [Nonomuraea phyllanthi]